eukprot:TRINITY_DN1918_c6_g1_i1.p1 TRINITY_DN1918_c6_g1~~TRINITY_DN1918_c6_g1_i1.p1  ORF type:complete len:1097 (-),score=248.95 TRINITY_DN1918_c6_g1_i1:65-3355(-)
MTLAALKKPLQDGSEDEALSSTACETFGGTGSSDVDAAGDDLLPLQRQPSPASAGVAGDAITASADASLRGDAEEEEEVFVEDAEVALRSATLKVGGMFCTNCSQAVDRALRSASLQGVAVETCEVDLINERAVLRYRSSAPAGAAFATVVEEVGFDASILEDRALERSGAGGTAVLHLCWDGKAGDAHAASKMLGERSGVLDVVVDSQWDCGFKVVYDPAVVGARALLHIVADLGIVVDPAGDAADGKRGSGRGGASLRDAMLPGLGVALFCTTLIMVVCWVLPCLPHCLPLLEKEVLPGVSLMAFSMLLLAIPVQLFSGWRFHAGAFHAIRASIWDMNVLISLGTGITFLYSLGVVLFVAINHHVFGNVHHCKAPPPSYFEAPCMVITFVLVGKSLESWAKRKTSQSVRDLLSLKPKLAHLLRSSGAAAGAAAAAAATSAFETISVQLLELDDILQVFPGEAAPADGVMLLEAEAEFDESLLTGESRPVAKKKGDFVIGGSTCVNGRAEIRVERLGSRTMLSQITTLCERAQLSRAPVQQVADDVARNFVPFVIGLAAVTWFVWWLLVYPLKLVPMSSILGDRHTDWPELDRFFFVLEHGLTVLLVACPCALGLATPTAVMTATGVAARQGILVQAGAVPLELGSRATRVVLDKTGTLTTGKPKVTGLAVVCPLKDPEVDHSKAVVSPAWERLLAAYRDASSETKAVHHRGSGSAATQASWLPSEADEAPSSCSPSQQRCAEAATYLSLLRSEAERAIWWAIGSAEISSEHPLAKELVLAASARSRIKLQRPASFQTIAGVGVRCMLQGMDVQVVAASKIFAASSGDDQQAALGAARVRADIQPGPEASASAACSLGEWVQQSGRDGATVVAVTIDGETLAAVQLRDTLSPHAKTCIAELQMMGAEVWMCTGDHAGAARAVAKEVGISASCVVHDALPETKVALVQNLRGAHGCTAGSSSSSSNSEEPPVVVMVGDGVNDAPALATADVGIAIGAGHDVTVDAADVVLVRSDLRDLVTFFDLARATLRTIWRNFFWALVFNSLALPVAAGALWRYGFTMTPPLAACLMLSSSLLVVCSSLSLFGFTATPRTFAI